MGKNSSRLIEAIRTGDNKTVSRAITELLRNWKDAPLDDLFSLKEQFDRLGLENREAMLDEALTTISERMPEPFFEAARNYSNPHWKTAVEVLSLGGRPGSLGLFLSMLPGCPRKALPALIRAIARFRYAAAVTELKRFLTDPDEDIFYEALMALQTIASAEAVDCIRECALQGGAEAGRATAARTVLRMMEGKSNAA
jgi:hypothetical protein